MRIKRKYWWMLLLAVFLILLWFKLQEQKKTNNYHKIIGDSIFSWEEEYLLPKQQEMVDSVMEQLDCDVIYQQVPGDMDRDTVVSFLQSRKEKEQDVYYLTGAAEWGIEKDADSMLHQIAIAADWNKKAGKGNGFSGIVWDVEPYLLDEWEKDKETVIDKLADNCAAAYKLAKKNNLRVILCIPNFYDAAGLEDGLERLTKTGCDALAVMNYNKNDEAGQIRTEVELAVKYQKGIINITELQKPGYHDLSENNTYYNDGIEGVGESWRKLEREFGTTELGFSWHYLKPAIQLLKIE